MRLLFRVARDTVLLSPLGRWPIVVFVLVIGCLCCFYRIFDYPTSTWYDPAYNGLDALRLIQRGGPVVFFPTNGGREALFIYLIIPFILAFGATAFSMRIVTAILGVLHIALLFGFLYDLPSLLPQKSSLTVAWRRTRLLVAGSAALIMATSYWHIVASRRGQRPILVPLFATLLFWLFLKAWHSGQRRWFVLSGIVLGLSGYTYGAGRLLPVILLLTYLPTIVGTVRTFFRSHSPGGKTSATIPWTNLALFLLTALLVYLPIGIYFLGHQAQFSSRAGSVMVWSFLDNPLDIVAELTRNTTRVLYFFCCLGNPLFGPPDFPGFNPLLIPFLAIGIFGAALNIRQTGTRLLLLWWVIGLIPSVMAIEAPHPYRMIVSVTPTAAVTALSIVHVQWWLRSHTGSIYQRLRRYVPYVVLILIALWTPITFWNYFVRWESLAIRLGLNDSKAIAIQNAVTNVVSRGTPVYIPMSTLDDSPLLYFLSGSFSRTAKLSIGMEDVSPAAYVIASHREQSDATWVRLQDNTATILPPLLPKARDLIQNHLQEDEVDVIYTNDGIEAGYGIWLDEDPGRFVEEPTAVLDVTFGPMRLIGTSYSGFIEITDEQPCVPVTLFWQADEQMSVEYEILVRLVDDGLRSWGSDDGRPTGWVYPTSFWRTGLDTVPDAHCISMDSETPPSGRYWLSISVYDPATGRRLMIGQRAARVPDTFLLGPVKAPLPQVSAAELAGMTPQQVIFGNEIKLESSRVELREREGVVRVSLLWQAIERPLSDYTVFLHLTDAQGELVFGNDSQPVVGTYPTTIWASGEYVLDIHDLVLANDDHLPSGMYLLSVGLYDTNTGQRLPLLKHEGLTGDVDELILDANLSIR